MGEFRPRTADTGQADQCRRLPRHRSGGRSARNIPDFSPPNSCVPPLKRIQEPTRTTTKQESPARDKPCARAAKRGRALSCRPSRDPPTLRNV